MNNLRRLLPRRPHSSRGQSLVEFAMVLPLLLMVGFIITEFGRALWIQNVITQAAREGCRKAVVSTVARDQKEAIAKQNAEDFLAQSNMGPSNANPAAVTTALETRNNIDILRVTVARQFNFIPGGPLPNQPFATPDASDVPMGTITLRSQAIMALE